MKKNEDEKWTGAVTAKEWVCVTKIGHSCLCQGNPNTEYQNMHLDNEFVWNRNHYSTPIVCATRYHARQVCKEWNDLVRKNWSGPVRQELKNMGMVHPVRVRFRMEVV